ncbi:MAG: hypothetical protein ACO1NQ_09570, partial [Flavobacteriales bacterium]
MRTILLSQLASLLLWGCGSANDTAAPSPNRWSDERLWPVLEAQEHRDVPALCALLKDSVAVVRATAAM